MSASATPDCALAGLGHTSGTTRIRSPGVAVAAAGASVAQPADFWKGSGVIHLRSMPMHRESRDVSQQPSQRGDEGDRTQARAEVLRHVSRKEEPGTPPVPLVFPRAGRAQQARCSVFPPGTLLPPRSVHSRSIPATHVHESLFRARPCV